jgi:hypothetical protein
MPTYPTTPFTFVATVSIVKRRRRVPLPVLRLRMEPSCLSLGTSGSNAIDVGHWTNINNNFSSAPINITISHDQGLWTVSKGAGHWHQHRLLAQL